MLVAGGSTDVTTYFTMRKTSDGTAATGLTIANFDLQYVRSGATPSAKVDAVALAATDTVHTDNRGIEIDATDTPGLYRIDWPDAAFAAGAREVILSVKVATAFTEHLRCEIDAEVNVVEWNGTDVTAATAGRPDVNVVAIKDSITLPDVLLVGIGDYATIDTVTSQTVFLLSTTQAPNIDDLYNGMTVAIQDVGASPFIYNLRRVVDYVGSTRELTIDAACDFTVEVSDISVVLNNPAVSHIIEDILVDPATDKIDGSAITDARLSELDPGNLPADIAAVQADTDNIQTRIPAALVSGKMDSDAVAISGSTAAADSVQANIDNLDATISSRATPAQVGTEITNANLVRALATGTADSGSTTTLVDAGRTEADADYWKGQLLVITDGTLLGQARVIAGFDAGTDTITVNRAFTAAVATHTYEIWPISVEVAQELIDYDALVPADLPSNFADLSITATNGRVDLAAWLGTAVVNGAGGRPAVDAEQISASSAAADAVQSNIGNLDATITSRSSHTAADVIAAVSGTADSGTTTTLVDAARGEADTDYWKGMVLLITSGSIAGQARRITAFNPATDELTVDTAFTQAVGTNTYIIIRTTYAEAPAAGSGDWTTAEKENIRDALGVAGTKTAASGGDMQDVQARLPATLIGGRMDSDVAVIQANAINASAVATGAIDADAIAANAITAAKIATDAIGAAQFSSGAADKIVEAVNGTADSGTTTTLVDAARTEADTDYWKGMVLLVTSGNIAGQARRITSFNPATDTITVDTAFTQAVDTNNYVILRVAYVEAPAAGSGDWTTAEKEQIRDSLGVDGTKTTATGGDVQDIQTRLPASLVGGKMDSDAVAISGSTGAADSVEANIGNLDATISSRATPAQVGTEIDNRNLVRSLATGTADSGSVTTLVDAALTQGDTDYWKGAILVMTSGNLLGQARVISAFNPATDTITVNRAFTQAVGTQTYEIWPLNPEVAEEIADANVVTTADLPSNFADLSITATSGRVDLGSWLGVAVANGAGGRPAVDAEQISASTAAADSVQANIPNLDVTVSSRATPAQVGAEITNANLARALLVGTATGGSTTTLIDTVNLTQVDTDYWKGQLLVITSGNLVGQCRVITAFNLTTDTITVNRAFTQSVVSQTYEIWPIGVEVAQELLDNNPTLVDDIWDEVITGVIHNVTNSAGRRLRQLQENLGYEGGAIWIDTVNGTAGTEQFENGTVENPVDNIADANTLAASLGLSMFQVVSGSTITLTAGQTNHVFSGINWTIALGGQSIDGTMIHGATVSGIATNTSGSQMFRNCIMNAVTIPSDTRVFGSAIAGTQTLGEAGDYSYDQCHSAVAGTGTPVWDFGVSLNASNLNVRHHSGGVEIANMGAGTGSYEMSLEGDGQLVIAASCSATSAVAIRGHFTVTDNAGGVVTLSDDARVDQGQILGAITSDSTKFQGANVDAAISDVEADTQDIQARIPAGLVSGRMNSNVAAIDDNAEAALDLAASAATVVRATVDTVVNGHTPTTTEFQADTITEATADHFNGRIVIFTSGVLKDQATDIVDYVLVGGIGQFTVTAMTEAPANNDTFVIV